MNSPDQSQRFIFESHPIRGQHVSLNHSWQEIAKQSGLQGRGLTLLGEALAAVGLLVDTLKIKGSITLQIRGSGPMPLLVVEANSNHQLRGIARQQTKLDDAMDLQEVFGSNTLVITIKTEGAEPYQGIAPLQGKTLADALEFYFATSEQLPTHFWLGCNSENACGMLIQKLPGELEEDDAWNRVMHLASTITEEELLSIDVHKLLHRLFHEEVLRLFDPHPVEFSCSCSRERTSAMLLSLGKSEVDEILLQEGEISVNCEFCNADYRFDKVDIEQIFSESGLVPGSSASH